MRKQLAEGDRSDRGEWWLIEPGDVVGRTIVEAELPPLGQLEDGGSGEGLGVRGDAEEMVGAERNIALDIGVSVSGVEEYDALVRDGGLDPGQVERALPMREPAICVRGDVFEQGA